MPQTHPSVPTDRGAGAADPSAEVALQAAVIRGQAALLARRERALEGASAGLWECRLQDEALDWTGQVYDLFEIPRGTPLHRAQTLALYPPSSQRLLPAQADPRMLAALGRCIVAALGRPVDHRGRVLRVGASVGIARGGAGPPADLFARADAALYAAKAAGRNTVRIDGARGRSAPGAA